MINNNQIVWLSFNIIFKIWSSKTKHYFNLSLTFPTWWTFSRCTFPIYADPLPSAITRQNIFLIIKSRACLKSSFKRRKKKRKYTNIFIFKTTKILNKNIFENHLPHSFIDQSQEPLTRKPFLSKATDLIEFSWPVRVLKRLPEFLSQSLMLLSKEPLASKPFESKSTAQTSPVWPVRLLSWPALLSQSLTAPSLDPLASKWVESKATETTP